MTPAVIASAFAFTVATIIIVHQAWKVVKLEEKNEAQRLMIEEMQKPPEKPKPPSRIEVRYFSGRSNVVYGGRMVFNDGILQIITRDDYLAALFAKGGWMSAIVVNEEKKKEKADGSIVRSPHAERSGEAESEADRGSIRQVPDGDNGTDRGSAEPGAVDSQDKT
jgi:hypothetical protein